MKKIVLGLGSAAAVVAVVAYFILPKFAWWNQHVSAWRDAIPGQGVDSVAADHPSAGNVSAGRKFFFQDCSSCHMINGQGGVLGPDLSDLGRKRTLRRIQQALLNPDSLRNPTSTRVVSIRLKDGRTFRGVARNESTFDLQLQTLDAEPHFFTKPEIAEEIVETKSLMPSLKASREQTRDLLAFLSRLDGHTDVSPPLSAQSQPDGRVDFGRVSRSQPGDWPTYSGQLSGNRHSPLTQINASNVSELAAKWVFPIKSPSQLETTPLVVDGVMYVTAANQAWALDAREGRDIWHYSRPLTSGLIGDAATAINRGAAILGDKVFMVTDNAHLMALSRTGGNLVWDTTMADYHQHYGATAAPLVVKDLVISGISGGDEGARGFLAAYKASTGERVWRFWTVPAPGEPGSETWKGRAIEHGCAATWMTGSYDSATDLVYWATGNPCPDYNGDERQGDNLYSNSILAIEASTGKLRWYFQVSPHDLHDWDANEPIVLADADFRGRARKLLLQANRNGFFYVLDRTTGEFLEGEPFVHKLTWASRIGPDGRPKAAPGLEPTESGAAICPCMLGATNWMATAYNPDTGLFYVVATECCSIYAKSPARWKQGERFFGGSTRHVRDDYDAKFLRAIDIQTGKIAWELPIVWTRAWGGLMSTAGNLVFYGDESGALGVVDARTGKPLWHFHTNQPWRASAMTYTVDGKQYVAIAAASMILAFALP
jgi:alcohol dehydrogenase (cytochrome c)